MDYLNELNNMISGQKITMSAGPHPKGQFPATIVEVLKDAYQGKEYWELKLKTSIPALGQEPARIGSTSKRLYPIDQDLVLQARTDAAALKRVVNSANGIKSVFINCGVVDQANAELWTWQNILESFGSLIGKSCEIKIEAKRDDPTKSISYINKLRPGQIPPNVQQINTPQQAQQAAPMQSQGGTVYVPTANGGLAQVSPQQPQQQQFAPPSMQPVAQVPLDQIPF